MYAPFSALHPTPSRLTSTTSTSGTAATESMDVSATASEDVIDGSCECSDMLQVHDTEGDDDYVNVDAADGLNGVDNEPEDSVQIQDNNESSDNIDDAAELKPNGHDPRRSTSSVSHDSDLDRKVPAKSATAVPQHKKHKANKDNRFLCSICLETVSDEPVVTRCGHLYCWSCLYQWLEPGMLLSEYTAAFGAPRGVPLAHAGSRGTGLNFLNEMTYTNINVNHRPYNPSGGRYIESRRCCPVCKADCTVDSVIPVYINHSGGSVGDDGSIDLGSADSISSAGVNAPVAAAAVDASMEQNQSPIPHSPTLQTARSSFDTDPTSNVGLRRRRSSPRRNESSVFDSPLTETTFVNTPRPSNANQALNDTPIHRNGSQIDEQGDRSEDNATTQVPSRPVPTSPWITNRTLHSTTSTPPSSAPRQFNQNHDHTMGTSSPFRLALRPRRQPFLSASPPIMHYADTQHRGGLTSVLMGIVDSIDNLAASQGGADAAQENPEVPTLHRSDGGMGGIGRASEQTNQDGSMNVLSEDESSLEMAREFLSRLLLMLACFVVLCLLLF